MKIRNLIFPLIGLLIGAVVADAQFPSGPGELGLPGVTVYGTPPGPNYLPLSTGNDRAQWYGLGAGFSISGNTISVSGGGLPTGSAGQILGFTGAGAGENENVGGDCTFARTGANAYSITCTKTNGVAFGNLATANAGTSLTLSGGNLNLNMPGGTLPAHNFANALSATGTLTGAQPAFTDISGTAAATQGGTGISSPTAHDVMITEGSSPFTLLSMGVDTFLQGNGASVDASAGSLPDCPNDGAHAYTYSTSTHTFSCTPITGGSSAGSTITVANEGTTGTTLNKLAKFTGAPSTAIITATTDTGGAIGIVTSGAGTTGSATIQTIGLVNCAFDGATTAGDYAVISGTTAGDCADAGSGYPSSGEVVGRVLSTNASGGTYQIDEFPPEMRGVSAALASTYISGFSSAAATNPGTSITVPIPAGLNNGDMMVACVGDGNGTIPSAPAGWSAVGAGASNGTNSHAIMYSKVASSESGSYVFSWTGSTYGTAGIVAFHNLSSAAVDSTVTAYATGGLVNTINVASANTTATSNDIYIGCAEGSNAANSSSGYIAGTAPLFSSELNFLMPLMTVGTGYNGPSGSPPRFIASNPSTQQWAAGIAAVKTNVGSSGGGGGSNLTGVTAGYGLLGGGTAGNVTLSSYPPTPISLGATHAAQAKSQTVGANATATLLNYSGTPGNLVDIWIVFNNTDATGLSNSTLTITRDGEGTPSINAVPLYDIFQDRGGANVPRFYGQILSGGNGNTVTVAGHIRLLAPWTSSILVQITNGSSTTSGTLWYNVYYQTQATAPNWGNYAHLHAAYYNNASVAYLSEVPLMDISDAGANITLWGIEGTWTGATDFTYLEGHVKAYGNGSGTAFFDTDATEDYFQQYGFFLSGEVTTTDFGDPYRDATSVVEAYRFHDVDPISATNELKVTWTNGVSGFSTNQTAAVKALLWYYTSN